MSKRIRMFMSTLLALCIVLSVVPAEILATESVSATVGEGSSAKVEESVIAPEDNAPLLDANCKILQYVNEEAFAAKGHVARIPGEETLSSYVFRNADNSRTVYYMDEPVKYIDATGAVREKDLTLISATSLTGEKAYTTSSNDIGLTLPNDPANGIGLSYEGSQITLVPQGGVGKAAAQLTEGAVTYPDYYGQGVSLRYTPTLDGVKEDIILKAYTGVNSFTFLLNTGGLRMYREGERYYLAASQESETRFELGDVVSFDAHGRFSVGTMTVETLTMGQSYRLTLTVDASFLTDENTTYPVSIDPTLTVSDNTHGSGAIEDATIYEGKPSLNTGSWQYHYVGIYDDEYGDGRTVFRLKSLLQSSIYSSLSADQITSVTFHAMEASGNADGIVYLFSMNSDAWTESGITWNNMVTFHGVPYATTTLRSNQSASFNITSLVKEWKNGTRNANAGFVLRANYDNPAAKGIYSSEFSTSSYRPYVTMTYNKDIWLDKNIANVSLSNTTTLTANSTQSDATVTWTSSDTSVATVSSTGSNTCRITPVKFGVATITARLSTGQTDSCEVYVYKENGVYFLRYGGNLYLSVDGGMVEGSTLTLQTKKNSELERMRQLWKFEHIGQHYYSIRSLYRPDLALIARDDGIVEMASLNTILSGSSVPLDRRWTVNSNGSYCSFQYVGTASLSLQPNGTSVSTGIGIIASMTGSLAWLWSMEQDASVADQLLLIDTQTGLPATNTVKYAEKGDQFTLAGMNLMVSCVSGSVNQTSCYWLSSNEAIATVNYGNGTVTAISGGRATITVHSRNTSIDSVSYTLDVALVENGVYYIRSWASDLNLELGSTSSGVAIYRETFTDNSSQRWTITYLGNDVYSIQSTAPGAYYLGVENDSSNPQSLIVPRTGAMTDGMRWKIEIAASGAYKFIPLTAGNSDMVMGYTIHTQNYAVRQLYYSDTADGSGEWLLIEPSNEIVLEAQQTRIWCWVACARMASMKYVNSPISQAAAAVYIKTGVRTLNPTVSQIDDASQEGGLLSETAMAIQFLGGPSTYYAEDKIYSESTLRSLLDSGNIVVVARGYYVDGMRDNGHVTLVHGYHYNSAENLYLFHIYDPSSVNVGSSYSRSYSWICNGQNKSSVYDYADSSIWDGILTFRIGNYTDTIPASVP